MALAYCSNKECDHDEHYEEKAPKFCTQCGSQMHKGCLKCLYVRRSRKEKFCYNCGNSYK